MAQFRAYRLPRGGLALDLQSDLIDTPIRVVAPLRPRDEKLQPYARLKPILDVDGAALVLHTNEVLGVPAKLVSGLPAADLSGQRDAIVRAIDVLFFGF